MFGEVLNILPRLITRVTDHSHGTEAFRCAVSPILICDGSAHILAANPAAQLIFDTQLIKSVLIFMIGFESRAKLLSGIRTLETQDVSTLLDLKMDLVDKTGRVFPAELKIVRSFKETFYVYIEDQTAHRQALDTKTTEMMETAEREQLKTRFLAAMSHEIRTPFNAVSGLLDILSETELDEEQQGLVRTGQDATAALLQITNDMLDYSKITAGKLTLIKQSFSAKDVFDPIFRLFEPVAQSKGLQLLMDLTSVEDVELSGDLPRLRQVLTNFVSNAIKFTAEGSVTLWAGTSKLANGEYELTCVVKDTGIGISMMAQSELFGEFYRVEDGDTRKHEGTGLGLAISKILVRMMDGLIGVNSGVGQGSNFWITIPLECVARTQVKDLPQKGMNIMDDEYDISGLRVLLADDNKTNLMILSRILDKAGAHVTTVENGAEALEVLNAAPFDVALLDISMPVMGGLTATRHIRAADMPYKDLPILALTAIASTEQSTRYIDGGMTAVMTKPVSKFDLIRTISISVNAREAKDLAETGNDTSSDLTCFDQELLQSIFSGLEAHDVQALRHQFASDLQACVAQLDAAILVEDRQAIQRSSHTLKGLSATFGCKKLSELAELTNYNAIKGSVEEMVQYAHHSSKLGHSALADVDVAFSKYAMAA